jgi:guanylate kinase
VREGILFVISAPSGAGKTTLCDALRQNPDFTYAVSCTTRSPRPGEVDGEDYHFLEPADFDRRIKAGEFLEFAEVHGNRYGTLKRPVLENLAAGRDVLIDIDIVGARQIRSCSNPLIRRALVDIFLMPPSIEELRRRLERRGTETPEAIATRIANAEREMAEWPEYRYVIISESIEQNLQTFRSIMTAERCRTRRYATYPPTTQ